MKNLSKKIDERLSKIPPGVLFFSILVLFYFLIDYHRILFYYPQSIHFIRQTDSLAFASHFYLNDLKFWEPGVLSLNSTDGKVASGFPILYYLTAVLYKLFGQQDFFLRLLNLSLFSAGFYYLFRLLSKWLSHLALALTFTFLFLSSMVLLYYGNNFLPNTPALGLTLIGWYFFYRYFEGRNPRDLWKFSILFLLGSLIRTPQFFHPIAAISSLLLFDFLENRSVLKTWQVNKRYILAFAGSFALILVWIFFTRYYNTVNQDMYFRVSPGPIWSLPSSRVSEIWYAINTYWTSSYYYPTTFHTYAILMLGGIIFFRHGHPFLRLLAVFSLLGGLSYILLFFELFADHDYYMIAVLPSLAIIIVHSFVCLRNRFPKVFHHIGTLAVFLLICILSLYYGSTRLAKRYASHTEDFPKIGHQLHSHRDLTEKMQISDTAKVVVMPDLTPNGGLYFISRKGWTVADTLSDFTVPMERLLQEGATHLIITETELTQNKQLAPYLKKPIGQEKGIFVFSLNNN